MKKILIDSNIYVEAMSGNTDITSKLRKIEVIAISSIVIGELLTGFRIRDRPEKQLKEFEEFLDSPRVELLSVSYATADF